MLEAGFLSTLKINEKQNYQMPLPLSAVQWPFHLSFHLSGRLAARAEKSRHQMTAFSDEKLEREALGTVATGPSLQGFFNEGSRRSENTDEN